MPIIPNPHPTLAAQSKVGPEILVDILADVNDGYVIDDRHLLVNTKDASRVVTRLLPEATSQEKIQPRLVIQHTNGGENSATIDNLFGFRNSPNVKIEAHLQVQTDGVVGQFMPYNVEANANSDANRFVVGNKTFGAISHETQDRGSKHLSIHKDPWSVPQLAALIGATAAECVTYNIRCSAPTTWNDSGIGHHALFPFLGLGPNGLPKKGAWTGVAGKPCPGSARIKQMDFLRHEVAVRMAAFYERSGGKCP
jgi:hypothetical protein